MPSNNQMTSHQQVALLSVFIALSNSPEAGAEALKGDEKKMAAGEYLIQRGLVQVSGAGISITQRGVTELTSMGLIQQGMVTDKGQQLINPKAKAVPAPTQQPKGLEL